MDQQILSSENTNDVQVLERKRDKILAVVFLIFSALSILNIPKLIATTLYDRAYFIDLFNVVLSLVMLIIVVMLFKHKPVLKWFLYVVLIGAVGSIIFWAIDKNWIMVTAEVALAAYVVYYIRTPLTTKVHKKANYILLPLAIVLGLLGAVVTVGNQTGLRDEIANPNSQFNMANLEVQQAYLALTGEQNPALLEEKFEMLKLANDKKLLEIDRLETKVNAALDSSNSRFRENNEFNEALLASMKAHKAQSLKLKELIDFNESFDNATMTEEQGTQNLKYLEEITALETSVRQTGAELQKFLK